MTRFGRKPNADALSAEPEARASPLAAAAIPSPVVLSIPKTTEAEAKEFIRDQIFMRVEPLVAVRISKQELTAFVNKLVAEIANDRKILLNQLEQHTLGADIVDEMVGLGPIEPLLRDLVASRISSLMARERSMSSGAASWSIPSFNSATTHRFSTSLSASPRPSVGEWTSSARCWTPGWRTAAAST